VGLAEDRPIIEKYADILEEELNVKKVRLLDAASEAMDFTLNPQPKQLGQKYGKLFPVLRKAILALEPMEAGKALLEGKSVTVTVDGENYEILPEEVEVRANAHTVFCRGNQRSSIAALETTLTPELVKEGWLENLCAASRICARLPDWKFPIALLSSMKQVRCWQKRSMKMQNTSRRKRWQCLCSPAMFLQSGIAWKTSLISKPSKRDCRNIDTLKKTA
jgi:hypothetical protein